MSSQTLGVIALIGILVVGVYPYNVIYESVSRNRLLRCAI
jgi:hypothetical protein